MSDPQRYSCYRDSREIQYSDMVSIMNCRRASKQGTDSIQMINYRESLLSHCCAFVIVDR